MSGYSKNIKLTLLALFLAVCPLIFSCSEPSSPFGQTEITLTALDASCTEVWLELKFNNLTQPADVAIKKDGSEVARFLSVNKDTVFYIDGLLPSQNYTFEAIIRYEGKDDRTSNSAVVTTMDTTSHNFTWQTWEFGQHSSSVLYDVAIIDENNIWAVGEIYMKDSLGNPDPTFYNAIHWNGIEWKFMKLFYKGGIWAIKTIYCFSARDIWFSGYMRYKNEQFIELHIPSILMGWEITKMWGTSSRDLYVVGNAGNIAHYNGTSWQKIESGTDVNLRDIWGSPDGNIVWICGRQDTKPTVLLKYANNSITKIIEDTENLYNYRDSVISGGINSIWTNDNNKVFVLTWFDLYRAATNTNGEARALWSGNPGIWGVEKIRANNINDFIACGVYGRIWHYNGGTWKRYEELVNQNDVLYGISIKGNIVVSVGNRYYSGVEDYGLIHLGKR